MKAKRGARVELVIEELDAKGMGVARLDGLTVRVRGALPGDRVHARLRRIRRRLGEADARLLEVVDPGVPRVKPRCAHVDVCGGCVWQDVPYTVQVDLKQELVERCLNRVGIRATMLDPLPAEDPFYYRNKMEFSIGQPEGTREGLEIGLHHSGKFDRVFDLEACHLQSETSNEIVHAVRTFARERSLTAYDLKRHAGQLRFLTIREGKRTGETMVILTTSEEEVGEAKELSALLAERFPGVRTVVQAVNGRKAQVATGDSEVVLHGDGAMQERLGDFRFEISPTSFFQTNTLQAEKLYGEVVQMARTGPNARVLDLYCGTGAISLFLSQEAQTVVGVELLEAALQDALRNAAANGIENCQFVAGKAEEVLGQMRARGEQFDSAVTDPPRAGMHPKALQAMADLAPETIVYVSCNPQALAMDLQRLEANGYKTDCLRLVDMFPHTPHCEVVVRLNRNQT